VPLLEVQDLSVAFALPPLWPALFKKRCLLAVDGISFTLAAGETLALVGESGSGKSTVARTIIGLQHPQQGRIRIAGHAVSSSVRYPGQSAVQLIFQDPQASLDPRFNAARVITEPLLLRDNLRPAELREAAAGLLGKVGLSADYLQRYPHELSGGQRQRLGIARAISVNPKIIIADEAVSALDASTRLQILELLGELQRQLGIAYLFITHDLAVVQRLAHRVAVMRCGRIVEIGPVAAIMQNPQHPYTQRLWAAARRQILPTVSGPAANDGPRIITTGALSPPPPLLKVAEDHYVAATG
jgi:ABC-type oligopeptide transport system ATPase subunit